MYYIFKKKEFQGYDPWSEMDEKTNKVKIEFWRGNKIELWFTDHNIIAHNLNMWF